MHGCKRIRHRDTHTKAAQTRCTRAHRFRSAINLLNSSPDKSFCWLFTNSFNFFDARTRVSCVRERKSATMRAAVSSMVRYGGLASLPRFFVFYGTIHTHTFAMKFVLASSEGGAAAAKPAAKKPKLGFFEEFMLGGVAAGISKTASAPIERVKLLVQNQDEMIKAGRLATPYKVCQCA